MKTGRVSLGQMMCSGVWYTKSTTGLEECYCIKDTDVISMQKALEAIGTWEIRSATIERVASNLTSNCPYNEAQILEAKGNKVSVVTAVQAMKWYAVRVSGINGHSSTTPVDLRFDALVTASRLIAAVSDNQAVLAWELQQLELFPMKRSLGPQFQVG
ncbi:hypothetical protein N431DRAFT_506032 [Stipitochalara longipes BDJ]|nr:hypothetical protein N431DRAFT_506032 [Stipitochalara longipes BDJ]